MTGSRVVDGIAACQALSLPFREGGEERAGWVSGPSRFGRGGEARDGVGYGQFSPHRNPLLGKEMQPELTSCLGSGSPELGRRGRIHLPVPFPFRRGAEERGGVGHNFTISPVSIDSSAARLTRRAAKPSSPVTVSGVP